MADRGLRKLVQSLRQILPGPEAGGQSDGQLLARFIAARDESAFAALFNRHGPMVLGVCRRVLNDWHDAEDAFQATFLVLTRKAGSVVKRESVGSWLYGVAYRTALEARAVGARRRSREKQTAELPHPVVSPAEPEDWRPLLDRELSRLPEKYRAAVVLCDLEGRPRKEVARRLGVPEGTLSSRLAAARRLLAQRLARCGLALSGAGLAASLSGEATASVSAALASSTLQAASMVAANGLAAVSTASAALTKGVLRAMWMSKMKAMIVGLLVATMVGAGGLVYRGTPGPTAQAADDAAPAAELEALRKENALLKLNLKLLLEKIPAQKDKESRPTAVTVSQPLQREVAPYEDFTGRVEQVQTPQEGEKGVKPTYGTQVQFEMDERSYLRYQKLLTAKEVEEKGTPLRMGLSDEDGFPHEGVFKFFADRMNPKTGTVGAYGVFTLTDRLLPGMFARVRVPWGKRIPMLEVAEAVVCSDQGRHFVYVVDDHNVVRRREVKLGRREGEMQVLESGLQAADRVVTSNLKTVHAGDKVDFRLVPMPGAEAGALPPPTEPEAPPLDGNKVLPIDPMTEAEEALKALRSAEDKKDRDHAIDALENALKKLRESPPDGVNPPPK